MRIYNCSGFREIICQTARRQGRDFTVFIRFFIGRLIPVRKKRSFSAPVLLLHLWAERKVEND